ncbi:KipI family sensor histidine kinase inhibitor [Enemella evansiae]|nr:KipI family sensor histidine kinase inhibitor [Enemella evansiae]
MTLQVRPSGDRALLVELADADERRRLAAALEIAAADGRLTGVIEHVPGARTVLVRCTDEAALARVAAWLAEADLAGVDVAEAEVPEVTIPVRYDGPDLQIVAEHLGTSVDEVIERHSGQVWTVEFGGFMPGFGYLTGESGDLEVPRRDSPRTRVPPGSVALAGEFSAVYPQASPGGWQLIGSTDAVLWDVDRDPPALLVPGARVRFQQDDDRSLSERGTSESKGSAPASRSHVPEEAGLTVEHPGPQLLVEDLGRPGNARLGVTASGAMDRGALRLANRLLGNAESRAGLEILLGGATLRAERDLLIAVTGANAPIRIDGRPAAWGEPVRLTAGQVLEIGRPEHGVRCYLGVRGGVQAPEVLGSLASDPTTGLGPAPLAAGDTIAIGEPGANPPHPVDAIPGSGGGEILLPAVLGPRDDWFTPAAIDTLARAAWEVSGDANRVGVRLSGPVLERARDGELPSEGMVRGSVQVPASGQPIAFGPDHPTTGGYPVIAVIDDHATDLLGQARPGQTVRFQLRRARLSARPA